MTLVVARRSGERLRMCGDLRVTDPDAVRSGFAVGALKVVAIRPELCVGFSGRVGPAISALRETANMTRGNLDLDLVLAQLEKRHLDCDRDTDFVIACSSPLDLARIQDGRTERGLAAAFVGEPDAFAAYQAAYHAERDLPLPPEGFEDRQEEFEEAMRMSDGMQAVIENPALPTVGEAKVEVVRTATHAGFLYSPAVASHTQRHALAPSGVRQWGTAAQGAFAYEVLVPEQPGVGVIGLHFFQGFNGLYFDPLRLDAPEPFANVTANQFRAAVADHYKVALIGGALS